MRAFRAVVFTLMAVVFFYIAHQLTRFADLPTWATFSVLGFLAVLLIPVLLLPLLFWMNSGHQHKPWHDPYFVYAHFSIAYLNFILVFVILRDLFAFIANYLTPLSVDPLYNSTATVTLLVLPVVCILVGMLTVRRGPQRIEVPLKFSNLPKELEGFRILHITDLHIGRTLPTRFIKRLIEVAAEKPVDLVVYTGDILDDIPSRYTQDLELLKQIKATYGNLYVTGNHEYYWKGEKAITEFKKIGMNVLINESRSFKVGDAELTVWGVPDPAANTFHLEGPDFKKLAQEINTKNFNILLSHQPSVADIAAPLGFDLQLSGHTHGGQFFPWNVLIGFFEKYGKGDYKIENLQLYVNQGTGYWGPSLRLGTYCEVAEIILQLK